jgi:Holliday junction resolvasome RuvABC endonuclease subunit
MIALGLDVSEQRMGWAAVSYDDQTPLALGVESLVERDGGWLENQVFRAMRDVNRKLPAGEVVVVGIEDVFLAINPVTKKPLNPDMSLRHAGVVGMATLAVRVVFGDVTIWPLPAGKWRKAIGLKPVSRKRADVKEATMTWADAVLGVGAPLALHLTEDSADALGVATACALLTVKTDEAA